MNTHGAVCLLAEIPDEKSSSAKTITLRGSTPGSPAPEEEEKKQEEVAATKIQAAFRGHKTRKSMKQPEKSTAGDSEASKQEMEAEFRPDDQGMLSSSIFISE